MKKYKKEKLKYSLSFDIYYTGSLPGAHMFAHRGHILQKDIKLDDKIIHKGYMLFYNGSGNDLEIMSPEEWENDRRHCYKVDDFAHHSFVETWVTPSENGWMDWNQLSLDQMVKYLKNKYLVSSSGEAKCIHHLIEFYEKNKNKNESK